ncbi:hypothetical protein [Anatilimnocola floriformis]|uniref:hypothetical protein n=1 Tax=Anatilimnocola floriformis TaxID=2948575 RepID=UPI0020C57038|nr:hypothetical protein [Anatilimnocola floriformis]
MARIEVTVNSLVRENEQAVEAAPVRDLAEVLNSIRVDAGNSAPQYLKETEVPYGGE